MKAIKEVVSSGKINGSYINAFIFSSLVLDGKVIEVDNNVEMIMFENIRAVFILLYILCTVAFSIFCLEFIFIKFNMY